MREIVCKLLVRPEVQGQVSDLHARGEGETWTYVTFEIPSEKAGPSSLTSPGEDAILITKHGKDNEGTRQRGHVPIMTGTFAALP